MIITEKAIKKVHDLATQRNLVDCGLRIMVVGGGCSGFTYDMDLETKEMLVTALANFKGTMLFVSHDRTFLRGLSNRVLELRPGDGEDGIFPAQAPLVYEGSYSEFVESTGGEAAGVHR